MKTLPSSLFGLLALAALGGCGSPAPAGPPDGSVGELYDCMAETRAMAYRPGLTIDSKSGALRAILVESDPGPPARGSNAWTVKIVDANDVPQDGLTVSAAAFMPDHGHPATIKAVVEAKGGGAYSMEPIYLYMPGYWEVTVTMQPPGGAKDSAVFPVCIPG
jgi:hypothetical protein